MINICIFNFSKKLNLIDSIKFNQIKFNQGMDRSKLLKKLSTRKLKSSNVSKIIERFEQVNYSETIKSNPFITTNVRFGQFFKQNGRIEKHIANIYALNEFNKYYEHRNEIKTSEIYFLFDFAIDNKKYFACIIINDDKGSCDTCNMHWSKEQSMYVGESLEQLLNEIPTNQLDKLN